MNENREANCDKIKQELLDLMEETNDASYDMNALEEVYYATEKKIRNLAERLNFQLFKIKNNHFKTEEERIEIEKKIKSLHTSLSNKEEKYNENASALTNVTEYLTTQRQKIRQLLADLERCEI